MSLSPLDPLQLLSNRGRVILTRSITVVLNKPFLLHLSRFSLPLVPNPTNIEHLTQDLAMMLRMVIPSNATSMFLTPKWA